MYVCGVQAAFLQWNWGEDSFLAFTNLDDVGTFREATGTRPPNSVAPVSSALIGKTPFQVVSILICPNDGTISTVLCSSGILQASLQANSSSEATPLMPPNTGSEPSILVASDPSTLLTSEPVTLLAMTATEVGENSDNITLLLTNNAAGFDGVGIRAALAASGIALGVAATAALTGIAYVKLRALKNVVRLQP